MESFLETLECTQNSQAPFQPQQGFLRVFSLDHPLLGSNIQSYPCIYYSYILFGSSIARHEGLALALQGFLTAFLCH